jgi:RHS repeat-associated protein
VGTFTYGYVNYTGRLASIAYPNGQTTAFSYYNNAGDQRLQEIENATSSPANLSTFNYTYSPTGNITQWTRTLGASTAKSWNITQDVVDQLANIRVMESSTLVQEYAYNYDKAGNRTTEQIDASVTTSTFNNLNQLTGQTAGGKMRFEGELNEPATVTVDGNAAVVDGNDKFVGYADVTTGTNTVTVVATDASSNATTHNYEVTVTGGATRTLEYDLNGNLTDNGAGVEYSWDAANRLTKIDDGTDETEFVYDGMGRRVAEKLNSTVIKRWLWAPGENQPIEERNDDGDVVTKHYYDQGVYVPAASSPADKLFYTYDHLGSVRELTDDNETILARYEYDPYGRRTKLTGAGQADFGYTGHYQHGSGLILTWYRAYDPELGRWLSRDPLGEYDGTNLYGYINANVINLIDPRGEQGILAPSQAIPMPGLYPLQPGSTRDPREKSTAPKLHPKPKRPDGRPNRPRSGSSNGPNNTPNPSPAPNPEPSPDPKPPKCEPVKCWSVGVFQPGPGDALCKIVCSNGVTWLTPCKTLPGGDNDPNVPYPPDGNPETPGYPHPYPY